VRWKIGRQVQRACEEYRAAQNSGCLPPAAARSPQKKTPRSRHPRRNTSAHLRSRGDLFHAKCWLLPQHGRRCGSIIIVPRDIPQAVDTEGKWHCGRPDCR
jgi:hypothetical protein